MFSKKALCLLLAVCCVLGTTGVAIAAEVEMPELMAVPEDLVLDYYGISSADYEAAIPVVPAEYPPAR